VSGIVIAPSVLAADFDRLADEIVAVVEGGADWIHVDVMDGHFVPNLTFGAAMIETAERAVDVPIDVHLMVERPEQYFDEYVDAGADILTVHVEATTHLHRQLQRVRELGVKAGVAINPGTPLSAVDAVWGAFDLLLVMSVNPGWSGQRFIPESLDRLRSARKRIDDLPEGSRPWLEVDGGITADNAAEVVRAGVDVLVSGSGVYGGDDPAARVSVAGSRPRGRDRSDRCHSRRSVSHQWSALRRVVGRPATGHAGARLRVARGHHGPVCRHRAGRRHQR
jgi:ribulose-phosphate 3-epimerase